jgi:hypothetical protein
MRGVITPERLRAAIIAVAAYVSLLVIWLSMREASSAHYAPDFTALWTAARAPHGQIYDPRALTDLQRPLTSAPGLRPFPYPPTLLPLLAAFGLLPFWVAMILWSGVGLALLLASLRRWLSSGELALVAVSPGVVYAALSGQTSLLLGAGVAWAVFTLPQRPRIAGAVLGLVAAVKPQLVLLAPLALAFQPPALLAFGAAGLAAALSALALYGPGLWIDWLRSLPQFLEIVSRDPQILSRNLSPAGQMIAAGLGPGWLVRLAWGGLGAALVALAFRRPETPERRLGALVLGSILCAPYAMPYDAALLAPAAILLLRRPFVPAILAFLVLWLSGLAMALLALCLMADLVWPRVWPTARDAAAKPA